MTLSGVYLKRGKFLPYICVLIPLLVDDPLRVLSGTYSIEKKIGVLIPLLVDDPLRVLHKSRCSTSKWVLIPLLVDDPLRVMSQVFWPNLKWVLIPLLVDDPLRGKQWKRRF